MFVPEFNDIGKRIRDMFDKNFPAGFVKVVANLVPRADDIALNLTGSHNVDSGKLLSSVDTKMNVNVADKTFTIQEKWTTSNEIQSSIEVIPAERIRTSVQLNYDTVDGKTSFEIKNNYKSEVINASAEVKFSQLLQPVLTMGSMFKLLRSVPLYGGALVSFDLSNQKFAKINYGVQYNNADSCLALTVTSHGSREVVHQIYHRTGRNVDVAIETAWNFDSRTAKLGAAMKIDCFHDTALKAKLDNGGNLSLGYTFPIREGIKMTLGFKLECKNINGGGHKLGMLLEM